MTSEFHEKLVKAIRASCLDIADHAENIAGDMNFISDLTIIIKFSPEVSMLHPTITIERSNFSSRVHEMFNNDERISEQRKAVEKLMDERIIGDGLSESFGKHFFRKVKGEDNGR